MAMSLIDQYRQIHATRAYGNTSIRFFPYIIPHVRALNPRSVIDYGCGQSAFPDLIQASGVANVARYDPAIPAYAERPQGSFDLLINIDVLEHIPEPEIDGALRDMVGLATHALFVIDIKPANAVLPNGQNAHATIKPPEWWRERLKTHYPYIEAFFAHPVRRARFKTWPSSRSELLSSFFAKTRAYSAYRLRKVLGRR